MRCRLIAAWPGPRKAEWALHREFSAQRSHNEWFRVEGAVAAFVEQVRGKGADRIPDWSELTWAASEVRYASGLAKRREAMKAHWADPKRREAHSAALHRRPPPAPPAPPAETTGAAA